MLGLLPLIAVGLGHLLVDVPLDGAGKHLVEEPDFLPLDLLDRPLETVDLAAGPPLPPADDLPGFGLQDGDDVATDWRGYIGLAELRIRPANDVLVARGSLEVFFRGTSAWLGTTAT